MSDRFAHKEIAMGPPIQAPRFSADGCLAWEHTQLDRHEFVDGDVFAMAGAEDRHVTVFMNIAFALRQHLSSGPCRTYMRDMHLHVATAKAKTACGYCIRVPEVMTSR